MNNYVIGISAYYHDSSACLFRDGELIFACEEEKFTGIKHDSNFPWKTLDYIFSHYGLKKKDISRVCYYETPLLRLKRKKSFFKSLMNSLRVWKNLRKISSRVHYSTHHRSHMAYSFFSSGFKESAILSVDGVGEISTICVGWGKGGKIEISKEIKYPHSLGLFYSAMTAFLGFKPNEGEYKVMGLASFGNPDKFRRKIRESIAYKDLKLICNMNLFKWNKFENSMFGHELAEHLGILNREPGSEITQDHKDLAASVQERFESILLGIIMESQFHSKMENLCLGGGCAYNGVANGKIMDKKIFKKMWVPAAPSDAGSSIGACLDYFSEHNQKFRIPVSPFLGPGYSRKEMLSKIQERTLEVFYNEYDHNSLIQKTCKHLYEGKIVGWFQGRIEFGARALGNRSILADPRDPNMRDRINSVIKRREAFRPFAPMVCYDSQKIYFDSSEFIPYMNQVVRVRDEYVEKLPAITHIDGTARVQSVVPENPIYYLLKTFKNFSGFDVLLNTSFNIKDKTMVLTPEDALNTFLETEMDVLVMGNFILTKKKNFNNA